VLLTIQFFLDKQYKKVLFWGLKKKLKMVNKVSINSKCSLQTKQERGREKGERVSSI
jgi:hypothetical protein